MIWHQSKAKQSVSVSRFDALMYYHPYIWLSSYLCMYLLYRYSIMMCVKKKGVRENETNILYIYIYILIWWNNGIREINWNRMMTCSGSIVKKGNIRDKSWWCVRELLILIHAFSFYVRHLARSHSVHFHHFIHCHKSRFGRHNYLRIYCRRIERHDRRKDHATSKNIL